MVKNSKKNIFWYKRRGRILVAARVLQGLRVKVGRSMWLKSIIHNRICNFKMSIIHLNISICNFKMSIMYRRNHDIDNSCSNYI